MIDENTPYKQAEIIRDTWPQLYHLKQDIKQSSALVIARVLNKDILLRMNDDKMY